MSDAHSSQLSEGELNRFFSYLAPYYERHTHWLTALHDQRWRRFTAACLRLKPDDTVLDLATGTGQMARAVAAHPARPRVIGLDCNAAMLGLARSASTDYPSITYQQGDARALPFADNSFAAITMGFALRLLSQHPIALQECYRVLKPQGRVYFLETANFRGLKRLALQMVKPWLPRALEFINPRLAGYCQLLDSMLLFPSHQEVGDMLLGAGLVAPRSYSLRPALADLHVAEKL